MADHRYDEGVRNGILMLQDTLLKNTRGPLDKEGVRKAAQALWQRYTTEVHNLGGSAEKFGPLEQEITAAAKAGK